MRRPGPCLPWFSAAGRVDLGVAPTGGTHGHRKPLNTGVGRRGRSSGWQPRFSLEEKEVAAEVCAPLRHTLQLPSIYDPKNQGLCTPLLPPLSDLLLKLGALK